MTEKKAVLAVSFGTSYPDTCKKNIGAIEGRLREAFPGYDVRRAFTSGMIIRKLRKRDNAVIDTVSEAMERLISEGYGQVIIQPTHVINGEEYDDMVGDAGQYREQIHLAFGTPLLSSADDYRRVAAIVAESFPARPETAICLMGHGSTHFADSAYATLDYHFKAAGREEIFVGTVEGFPDFDTMLSLVAKTGSKRILLTPLMVVAGDHATNDMAGPGDSWKASLEAGGYAVECVLKGLGEYPGIRDLYAEHARTAQKRLTESLPT